MINRHLIFTCLALSVLSACNERAVYKNIQSYNRSVCNDSTRTPTSQREQCLEDAKSADYRDYQEQLKDIKKQDPVE